MLTGKRSLSICKRAEVFLHLSSILLSLSPPQLNIIKNVVYIFPYAFFSIYIYIFQKSLIFVFKCVKILNIYKLYNLCLKNFTLYIYSSKKNKATQIFYIFIVLWFSFSMVPQKVILVNKPFNFLHMFIFQEFL